jgi:hypothetical protein
VHHSLGSSSVYIDFFAKYSSKTAYAFNEGIFLMFCVLCFPCAVSLNDGHIFDIIFSDEYIMDIVGALECEYTPFINCALPLLKIQSSLPFSLLMLWL